MSNLVNAKVTAEKFGNYRKGDTIEGMHISTAKALKNVIEVTGNYEAPKRESKVAVAYKGNTPAESKKKIEEKTEEIKAEKSEEKTKENTEEKEDSTKKKGWFDKKKKD